MLDVTPYSQVEEPRHAGWPRSLRILLLVAALATFILGLVLGYRWLLWAAAVAATTGSDRVPYPFALLIAQCAAFALALIIYAAFLAHVILNRWLSTGWKIGWALLLLIFGTLAQILYWFRHVWREA